VAQRGAQLHQLLVQSGIALGAMAIVSTGLGWIIAGRVLRPLRTITTAARRISATSLNERIAMGGPNDELKELGDTFDDLLARLERSFDAQRRFVANASHELRTPWPDRGPSPKSPWPIRTRPWSPFAPPTNGSWRRGRTRNG
jgi:signal transduction histidine kinase